MSQAEKVVVARKNERALLLLNDPAAYCDRYYSFAPGSDEAEHIILKRRLEIFHELYAKAMLSNACSILEMGGGPTICSLVSAAQYAESIVFTDGSEKNVEFVKKWKSGGSDSHDFSSMISYTVTQLENNTNQDAVAKRQEEIRSKLESVRKADVTSKSPLDDDTYLYRFDVLSIHYCLLHAVKSHDEYAPCLRNLARYLKSNGLLLLSEMLGCFHAQRQMDSEQQQQEEGKHDHNHQHAQHPNHHHGHQHHHEHTHGHEQKTRQFIFDSVESAGFDILEHRFITREAALLAVPGAEDANAWTTVVLLARKKG